MTKNLILTSIFLFLLPHPLCAQSPLLPPQHPAYDFLERMEVLGLLDCSLLGSKPVSRVRIAELLEEVHEQTRTHPGVAQRGALSLSRVDQRMLAALRWEFARDAERTGLHPSFAPHPEGRSRLGRLHDWMQAKGWFTQTFYQNGLNFYGYESDYFDGYADPRGLLRVIRQEGDDRAIVMTAVGLRLRAHVGKHLGVYFDFLDTVERGRGPYTDRAQLYQNRMGYVGFKEGAESVSYDVAEFDLTFGGNFWELHATKVPLRWGPGRSGQLLLSDWGTSFHQLQAIFKLGRTLRLTYLFGTLKTHPEISDTLGVSSGFLRTIERSKYIAAHRLEWDPHPRLRLGFSEALIYGERDPELAYFIPVNFFWSAEHDLGDEDNALLSLDAVWIPLPRYQLYGEFLIDDITTSKLGTDYYGNKLGWLAGLFIVQPAGLRNFDLTLELAELRPFVYSNRFPINVYSHWTTPLGYRYPPNSRCLFSALRFRPHWRASLELNWTHLQHGANSALTNVGGDIFVPFQQGAGEEALFLGGILETTDYTELSGSYEVLKNLFVRGRGRWIQQDGENGWEVEIGFSLN
ncbi:MAG: capsule assembly Wzi family protein [bacterium]